MRLTAEPGGNSGKVLLSTRAFRSRIASAHGAYPQWRLALFSFWDQLNAILTSLPSPFIDMTSQSIMSNFVVIWTVIISFFYLGTRHAE